jgi:hypothetical protein
MEVKINAEVYAYYENKPIVYRIWVDNHLHNEREYWVDCVSHFIEEEIYVELEVGVHELTIEKVKPVGSGKLWFENITVQINDIIYNIMSKLDPQDKQTVKFKVY